MHNSYLRLQHAGASVPRHPLLAGFDGVPRIINGVWRVPVTSAAPVFSAPLTLIPSYPDLPMEMVYPRGERPDLLQLFPREIGRGRVVYFPWDIDRVFWEVLSADHGRLIANALEWATSEERPVAVSGPFFFHVEDCIRDWSVTGVQTCALPICERELDRDDPAALGGEGPGLAVDEFQFEPGRDLAGAEVPLLEQESGGFGGE